MSQVSVSRGRVTELAAALPIRTSGSARIAGFATASFALLAALSSAQSGGPRIELQDGRGRTVASLQAGDTVTVEAHGLVPKRPYDLVLSTGAAEIVGFARATATTDGELGPEVLWYDSGITGPDPAGNGRPGQGFKDLHEAEVYLAAHPLTVEVREQDVSNPGRGALVVSMAAPIQAPRTAPWLEFTDAKGRHRNAFEVGHDVMCVSGSGFAPGSAVKLFVTTDRTDWNDGDAFEDVTGFNGRPNPDTVQLGPNDTSFTVPVWPAVFQQTGRFDLIGRVVGSGGAGAAKLLPTDLLAHGSETGIHVMTAPNFAPGANQDLVRNLAGRRTIKRDYPGFEFQDTFLRHTPVFAALDPTDVPSNHPGGSHGAIYVVRHRSIAEWRQDPTLRDVTEGVEIRPIKPGTLEMTIGQVWADADPPGVESIPCDVVIDVQQGPGLPVPGPLTGTGTGGSTGGTSRVFNGTYDQGIDFIDKLGGTGLYVVDDPSEFGPYPIGRVDYDFPDAYDIPWGSYHDSNVDVRATVTYPGQATGNNVPVYGTNEQFPIVFILHGNHIICYPSGCNWNCSKSQRVPNWHGYDYLLDLWASHGFIAVSIDGFDVTCNDDRFIERASLILEHIRYWEDWNNPSIPDTTWNGRFWNRIDVTRVGIAGHSRGGEGAAGAVQINQDVALGHQIKACITIAPTDFNGANPPGGGPKEFLVRDTAFFNIMGSNDGDVWDDEGAQIFDRASPPKHRATKSQAFIYGAEHNSWNTVWVDPSWGGGDDDPGGPGALTHQQQQDTARVYMTTWWMAWLQDRKEMLAFHRGRLDSPKLSGVKTYWSFEDAERVDVDNFEDKPSDPTKNSLGGAVTVNPAPVKYQESSFFPGAYDGSFFQQTFGLVVGWNVTTTYESDIPATNQDVSGFTHLHIRATQIWDNNTLNTGGNQSFIVNLVDVNGVSQPVDVSTEAFAPLPVSYRAAIGPRKSMLSSIRVPLRSFTQDNTKLDLTQITKIVITFESTGLLGIDDIQFTK